jgi:signal transduction histidine kinase
VLSLTLFHTLTVGGAAGQVVVLYGLGLATWAATDRQLRPVGWAVPFVVLALAGPRATSSEAQFLTVLLAAVAPAAALAGIAQRARREAQMHSARSDLIAGDLVDHTARGERARIARELHDVVAHHISMVAVQAETARLTTAGMPAEGAQRLSAIGDAARAALTEMRRLLGVLRADADDDAAQRKPQPGIAQLNELLDQARDASGSGTRLILTGAPFVLDPGVELAAYRIAQEALTNVRRHAPGAAVDVEVHYDADVLRVRVRDNGPGPRADRLSAESSGGHGLAGMRERAAAVGGRLQVGGAPGGGFVVEAVLPARAEAAR